MFGFVRRMRGGNALVGSLATVALAAAALGVGAAPASANGDCVAYWAAGSGTWSGAPAAGGSGTAADPYKVGSETDLQELEFCMDAQFRQVADIALANPWTMIPYSFTGRYDGARHSITNLSIANPASQSALFSRINGGAVSNVTIQGASESLGSNAALLAGVVEGSSVISNVAGSGTVSGTAYIGGLVASVTDSTLDNVSFDGSVTGTSGRVGGIAGDTTNSSVTGASVSGTVTGTSDTGGVVGNVCGGTVSQATSSADVTGTDYVGGVVGDLDSCSGEIANAYSSGTVSGANNVGGIVGWADSGTLNGLFSEGSVTGSGQNVGGIAGILSAVPISNAHSAASVTGKNYVGGAIGKTNLGVDAVSASGDVIGLDQTGGLLGYQTNESVANAWASGSVSADSAASVGGLIGKAENTKLRNTAAFGDITVPNGTEIGGLVGNLSGNSSTNNAIVNSFAAGKVSATGSSAVGGLAGKTENVMVKRSFTTGDVAGFDATGGLIGELRTGSADSLDSWIIDSYTQGAVSSDGRAGGLVGSTTMLSRSLNIVSSYSSGAVSASSNVGGLVGYANGTIKQPVESFWNETANPTVPDGIGTKKTAAQLQDIVTFQDAGWDIRAGGDDLGNTWGICVPAEQGVNGGFPYLNWVAYDNPCAHAVTPDAPVLNTLTPADGALNVVATLGSDGGSPVTSVEYSLDGGDWVSTGGTSGTFTISGLTNGTSYRVAVRAVNEVGASEASNEVSATPVAPPGPTPGPTVTEPSKATHLKAKAGSKRARVFWEEPSKDGGSAITGYKVWLSKANQRSFSDYRTTTRTSMRFTKLRSGAKYWVKVKATNAQTSGCASVVKFRTTG